MKKLAIAFGSAVAGNWIAERFILKSGPDDPTGFIESAEGLGWDDAWRAGAIVATMYLGDRLVGMLFRKHS